MSALSRTPIRRVALVYPVLSFMPPLGLMCLAAALRKNGMETIILPFYPLEFHPGNVPDRSVIQRLIGFAPDLVGVGFLSGEWPAGKAAIAVIRHHLPGVPVVAGGRHPSNFPRETLAWGADLVIVGEGEQTLLRFIQHWHLSGILPASLPGIAWIDQDGFHPPEPDEELPDLDLIPAYDLVPYQSFVDARLAVIGRYLRLGWLETSRGCFSRCTYCRDPKFGYRLRWRPMATIRQDMETQLDRFDLDGFYLIDDMFGVNENRVIDFCETFQNLQDRFGRKLVFAATARLDTLTLRMIEILAKAGCTQLSIGLESGSSRIHEILQTGKKLDNAVPIFAELRRWKIDSFVNLIVGIPQETPEDIRATLHLLQQLRPNTVGVSFLTPYPGTPVYQEALAKGWIPPNPLDSLDFRHSVGVPQLEFGVSRSILEERRNRLLKGNALRLVANVARRVEFLDLLADLFSLAWRRPKQVARTLFHLARGDFQEFKDGYRNLFFAERFPEVVLPGFLPDHRDQGNRF